MRRLSSPLRRLSPEVRGYVRKRNLGLVKYSGCVHRVYLALVAGPKRDFIIERTVSVNKVEVSRLKVYIGE